MVQPVSPTDSALPDTHQTLEQLVPTDAAVRRRCASSLLRLILSRQSAPGA